MSDHFRRLVENTVGKENVVQYKRGERFLPHLKDEWTHKGAFNLNILLKADNIQVMNGLISSNENPTALIRDEFMNQMLDFHRFIKVNRDGTTDSHHAPKEGKNDNLIRTLTLGVALLYDYLIQGIEN